MNKMDLTRRGFLQTTNLLAAGTMSLDEAALAGLAESPFSIQSTQVKRVRFKSRRSFDEVLQRLHQLVPAAITPEQYPAAMMKAGGVSLESFEKVVRSQTKQSGCCSPNSITTSGLGCMVFNGSLRGGYLAIRSSHLP